MPSQAALLLWLAVIAFLFVRDQKSHPKLSWALWLPVLWFFLLGSRSLSGWLSLGSNQLSSLETYSEGSPIDRYSLLLMFVIALYIILKRNLRWASIFRENRVIFFFLFYCVLSAAWSEFPMIALKRLVRFSGLVPMILLILSESSPVEAAMSVLRRCSYLLVTLSFLFIRYFPQYGRYYNPFTYETAYCGVGGNKNELGILSLVAALVFVWDLMQKKGDKKRFDIKSVDKWATVFALLMTVYILRIAHSATALFCVLIGSSIIIGTSLPVLKKNPQTIAQRVIGLSAVLAVSEGLFKISTQIIAALGRDPTLTNRSYVWGLLLGMGTNPLVGTGYGSFWTANRLAFVWSKGVGALQSHNGYIETYLNLGIVGILFFGGLLVRCFHLVAREMPREFVFNQFRLAVLVIFALYNYTEAGFPSLGLLSALFFLMIIIVPRESAEPGADPDMSKASPAVL